MSFDGCVYTIQDKRQDISITQTVLCARFSSQNFKKWVVESTRIGRKIPENIIRTENLKNRIGRENAREIIPENTDDYDFFICILLQISSRSSVTAEVTGYMEMLMWYVIISFDDKLAFHSLFIPFYLSTLVIKLFFQI